MARSAKRIARSVIPNSSAPMASAHFIARSVPAKASAPMASGKRIARSVIPNSSASMASAHFIAGSVPAKASAPMASADADAMSVSAKASAPMAGKNTFVWIVPSKRSRCQVNWDASAGPSGRPACRQRRMMMSFTCSTRKPPPKRQWRSQRLAMRSKQRTSRAPHLPAIYTTRSAHARVERVGGISSSTRRRASSRSPCLRARCRHPRHRASSPCNRLMQRMRLRAPGWLYYCTLTRN